MMIFYKIMFHSTLRAIECRFMDWANAVLIYRTIKKEEQGRSLDIHFKV